MASVAKIVLDATDDAANSLMDGSTVAGLGWENAIAHRTAASARHGWPATLSPRWFRSVFGGWKTLDGLRINLGSLGNALCGASFARALAQFGEAVHQATARRLCNSFVLAHRPFDIGSASYSALIASLLASVPFQKRHLGLGASTALEQAKLFGHSFPISFRICAAKAAVTAEDSPDAMMEAHVKNTSQALGETAPDATACVVPGDGN